MMSIPQPETEFNNLVEELNSRRYDPALREFDKKFLEKRIEAIRVHDICQAFCLKGMLASIEGDKEGVDSSFKKAIEQSGYSPVFIQYYCQTLNYLGLIHEAHHQAVKAYEKAPENIDYLIELIELSLFINDPPSIEKYTGALKKLKGSDEEITSMLIINSFDHKNVFTFLSSHPGIESEVLEPCESKIAEVFGTPLVIELELISRYDEDHILGNIRWTGDFEKGMDLYNQFVDWYIAEGFDIKANDLLIFDIQFAEGTL